jgi:hypothetical protein
MDKRDRQTRQMRSSYSIGLPHAPSSGLTTSMVTARLPRQGACCATGWTRTASRTALCGSGPDGCSAAGADSRVLPRGRRQVSDRELISVRR